MKSTDFEAADLIWNWLPEREEPLDPADMLIVLGSFPTEAPAWAAQLWHQKLAPIILASGGFGRISGEADLPEADLCARDLAAANVPAEAVLIENKSKNTGENVQFSKEVLAQNGLKAQTGIIVTTPLLSRRQKVSLLKQWPEITWQVTAPANKPAEETYKEQGDEFVHLIVGEVERIQKYPAQGFTIETTVPPPVAEAKEKLIRSGFAKYILA